MKNITLEMSLKPFLKCGIFDGNYINNVCNKVFEQWRTLIKDADVVSILLWSSDGSEILDYRGNLEDEFEWAKYIGGANPKEPIGNDPQVRALHSRYYLYIDEPPSISYKQLSDIVVLIKKIGFNLSGKHIRVGAAFDPGPEFAKSPFKYQRHNEICQAGSMGQGQNKFVTCYSYLHGDDVSYAGFPQGIEEGLSLGAFLGKQAQCFLKDIGFDYLWFSNGFGFGKETWGTVGVVFDGKIFNPEVIDATVAAIREFWLDFRKFCDMPIETRGTNLSVGIDMASDATPYSWLNKSGLDYVSAPNSPWAALDNDFGLELMGYMSRIAELPEDHEHYPFRFYIHDPWWLNSPWLDRYQRSPHDIYLPLSVTRIDGSGRVVNPASVSLFTLDDSYGNMPKQVPDEVIPHIVCGMNDEPDEPGPIVWVYPFEQLSNSVFSEKQPRKAFECDWLIRGAINNGIALNTVVSDRNFCRIMKKQDDFFMNSILLVPVPLCSEMLTHLLACLNKGGRVLLYGSVTNAGDELLSLLGLREAAELSGELDIDIADSFIKCDGVLYPEKIYHDKSVCAEGYKVVATENNCDITATVTDGENERVASMVKRLEHGGLIGWVHGTISAQWNGGKLLEPYTPDKYFITEKLFRYTLSKMGISVFANQCEIFDKTPVLTLSRNRGAVIVSIYWPNTNVALRLGTDYGAMVLTGLETVICNGKSSYKAGRSWHGECRVFVKQCDGQVSCTKKFSGEVGVRERRLVTGLKEAYLYFLPEPGSEHTLTFRRPDKLYLDEEKIGYQIVESDFGAVAVVKNISGDVMISW